jgi:hypothetical protein
MIQRKGTSLLHTPDQLGKGKGSEGGAAKQGVRQQEYQLPCCGSYPAAVRILRQGR